MSGETRSLWYLSFCDAQRPKGSQFLGVAIVRATRWEEAVRVSWILGINPGGEVMFHRVVAARPVPDKFIERRLSREDLEELERVMTEDQ